MPKNRHTRLLTVTVLTAAAGTALAVLPATGVAAQGKSDLAEVRAATAQFHDVQEALDAGYTATEECVPGMGYHYVNFGLLEDPALDPTQPEVLLYADKPGGGLRLVAVEYIVLHPEIDPTTLTNDPEAIDPNGPELLGQHFHGPMPGHFPGMPVHHELHTWLWAHNKAGMFNQANSSIGC